MYEFPLTPHNEVVPGLSQADAGMEPAELFEAGFDAVIDMSGRRPLLEWAEGKLYVWHPIDDIERLDDPEMIRSLARLVAELVRRGGRVAVNCAAGLNRSGLVVARALLELGYEAEEAIALVREARGPWALSNGYFERWLLEEAGVPAATGA